MFILRQSAARLVSRTSSRALLAKPRSFATATPSVFQSRQQQWSATFQRRFNSDEATKTPESFAQTATEAPIEENLTSAQEEAQAEPTDASATVTPDALEAAPKQAATEGFRRTRREVAPNNMVYVGNLYYEVTKEQLQRVFSRFGEVKETSIVFDNRGLSRGFGYVEFTNVADAQAAIDNLNTQVFEGRNLVVQFHAAKPNSKTRDASGAYTPNAPSKTLFIGNMSFEMSDKDLNDLFRDIRNVMDVRVAIDRRTGQPRGFAHADFVDVASATRAKDLLQDKVIYGRELRIDYSSSGTNSRRSNGNRNDRTPQ